METLDKRHRLMRVESLIPQPRSPYLAYIFQLTWASHHLCSPVQASYALFWSRSSRFGHNKRDISSFVLDISINRDICWTSTPSKCFPPLLIYVWFARTEASVIYLSPFAVPSALATVHLPNVWPIRPVHLPNTAERVIGNLILLIYFSSSIFSLNSACHDWIISWAC